MGLLEGAAYTARFMAEQWKDADAIAALQEKRLERTLQCAHLSPYYRNLFDISGIRPGEGAGSLSHLPTTSKEAIQSQPDSFIIRARANAAPIAHETTGSTGKPLRILMDQESATIRSSIFLANMLSLGVKPWELTAMLTVPSKTAKWGRTRRYGILHFLALDIHAEEKANLEAMRKNSADSLGYYPSAMVMLALENQKSAKPLKLARVLSGAELLAPDWRRLLEDSFSCPLFNLYGAWEFGPIAWECPEEHSLHINTGSLHMEILDSANRPCTSGTGRVVVTSLSNGAMPLLRYELGDLASWGGPCPCGRGLPVLKSMEGRADDMVVLPSGRLKSPLSFRFTDLKCVAEGVRMYQLVQENEGLFVFRYVPKAGGLSQVSEKEIEKRIILACSGEAVRVEFEISQEIRRNRRGKLHRLVSKVPRPRPGRVG